MTDLPTLTTIPAHAFEPCKTAKADGPGLIDDPMCGYLHKIDADTSVFCFATVDAEVHAGVAKPVRVRDWTDAEIEAANR